MTPPVHSGEPETPKTEGGRALLADFEAGRLWADARPHLRRAILAIEREAAALAPGAGLREQVEAIGPETIPPGPDRDWWTDEDRTRAAGFGAGIAATKRYVLGLFDAALGATPDPRPETDPS